MNSSFSFFIAILIGNFICHQTMIAGILTHWCRWWSVIYGCVEGSVVRSKAGAYCWRCHERRSLVKGHSRSSSSCSCKRMLLCWFWKGIRQGLVIVGFFLFTIWQMHIWMCPIYDPRLALLGHDPYQDLAWRARALLKVERVSTRPRSDHGWFTNQTREWWRDSGNRKIGIVPDAGLPMPYAIASTKHHEKLPKSGLAILLDLHTRKKNSY